MQMNPSTQNMDPEVVAALMRMGSMPGRVDDQQTLLAQAMRQQQTPMPEGRRAGGTYVAANPLEHLGTGLQRYAGMRQQGEAMDALTELRNEDTAARQAAAAELMRRQSALGQGGMPGYAMPPTMRGA